MALKTRVRISPFILFQVCFKSRSNELKSQRDLCCKLGNLRLKPDFNVGHPRLEVQSDSFTCELLKQRDGEKMRYILRPASLAMNDISGRADFVTL